MDKQRLWLSWQNGYFQHQRSGFESNHDQLFSEHLFPVNCIEKNGCTENEAANGPFFKH